MCVYLQEIDFSVAMKLTVLLPACLALLAIVKTVHGVCHDGEESSVCSLCHQSPWGGRISRDCCFNSAAYLICETCIKNPVACRNIEKEYDQHINGLAKRQDDYDYQYPPQRRAKFFLGRRDVAGSDIEMHKKSRVFLGKRPSEFHWQEDGLVGGPQDWYVDGDTITRGDKRGRAFLGKRDVSKRTEEAMQSDGRLNNDGSTRRTRQYFGKRMDN